MRRFPFFDDGFKRRFDFICIEGKPAQLRADGLFLEFGAAPNEGSANDGNDDTKPVILNKEGCDNNDEANTHHVWPAEVAKISFAANDEREAEPDDEQGNDANSDAECIHKIL